MKPNGMRAVSAMLRAELFREIKAFVDRRDRRCGPDDARCRVSVDTLMTLKLKFSQLPLEHLEMIAAVHRDSAPGAAQWMKSKRPDLKDRRPADLLDGYEGIAEVKREIEKLFRAL